MKQPIQPNQIRALQIYLDSATYDNDYKPFSCVKISEQLEEEGLEGSKSAVNRWINDFDFKSHLELKIQTSFSKDKSLARTTETMRQAVEKDLVTVERNGKLISSTYAILEKYTENVLENIERTGRYVRDDIKLVKEIAILTTGREDKMLDRLASLGGDKVSSDKLLQEFNEVEIELED
ncbi:hypothetical protein [Aliarcobacter butzleri]|uniref:hypothetical protein n=1 Tax=Aliarcobacter butzleri TaxID=28197 RepID=UPI00125EB680|nr:hypothetical protein [Aliarcobacter butzleri]